MPGGRPANWIETAPKKKVKTGPKKLAQKDGPQQR
jgi:hypothetical protein